MSLQVIDSQPRHRKQIVCISSTHWHFLWQRPQQIMARLSDEFNILYVDPPFPVTSGEGTRSGGSHGIVGRIISVGDSLKVLAPYRLVADSAAGSDEQNPLNQDQLREQVLAALAYLNWKNPCLLWIYHIPAVGLVGSLNEAGVVYDCVDSFSSFSWAHPETGAWEEELARKADVILTSAYALYQERLRSNSATYLVPNAADLVHFSKSGQYRCEPPELKRIGHPRLGFIGAAYEWLDLKLLEYLATNNPKWNLLMIGPRQHGMEFPEYDNLYWLGAREYKALPWYLQYLDVMLIPFLENEVTKHANPIKLWEYLAAGKPVVSTGLPEVQPVAELIRVSKDQRGFYENCLQTLEDLRSLPKRNQIVLRARAMARRNSWEERRRQIKVILKKHFNF